MKDDTLPIDGSYILNLEERKRSGSHWCAVYNNNEYYDSYGLSPPEVLKHIQSFNRVQHQALSSPLCGLYVACYIHLRNLGFSQYQVNYRVFRKNDQKRNLQVLEAYIATSTTS